MEIQKRLSSFLLMIAIMIVIGSAGYYILFEGNQKLIDCIYMTVISVTSVGYGEVFPISGNFPAQVFTMVLITFGMGIILYAISTITALLIEGELSGILRTRKMEKQIDKLNNHFIVCGGGKTSRPLITELRKNEEPVVLIESDRTKIDLLLTSENLHYIEGDATDDNNLIRAGIERAAGIIIVLPSDKDTLYVTMSARMLNGNIRIISKMSDPTIEPKLRKAGANRIVSPNVIGGLRMASEMIRPTAVDFLDQMLRSENGDLRIHEINIPGNSPMIGKKIKDSGLENTFDLLVLGAKNGKEEIEFNPPSSRMIEEGMTLVVMGYVKNIVKIKESV